MISGKLNSCHVAFVEIEVPGRYFDVKATPVKLDRTDMFSPLGPPFLNSFNYNLVICSSVGINDCA